MWRPVITSWTSWGGPVAGMRFLGCPEQRRAAHHYWVSTDGDIFDSGFFSAHPENHHDSREETKGQTQKTGR